LDLTTIHKAKGLEWPAVFIPCISAGRFPSSKTGRSQTWRVPHNKFSRVCYEGTENDERRLFYVGITPARDWLSVSTHDTPNKRRVAPSSFLFEFADGVPSYSRSLPLPLALEKKEMSLKTFF
jgi:DNA helicase-2/ATP-dependent DNA helicase PcrA